MKKNILFFSRSGHQKLFCKFDSAEFNCFHATLNKNEKKDVLARGGHVVGCIEDSFDTLEEARLHSTYLKGGFQDDRFLNCFDLKKRIEILKKEKSFWKKIIEEWNIDIVVHETISIEPEEVLSIEAKEHGVTDLTFLNSVIDGYFYFKRDPYSSSFSKRRIEEANVTEEDLILSKNHVRNLRERGHYPSYLHKTKDKKQLAVKKMIKNISQHVTNPVTSSESKLVKKLMYYNNYDQSGQNLIEKLFDSVHIFFEKFDAAKKIVENKIVFYPFHFEPEATLRYFSPNFSDQIALIKKIARYLPHDMYLAVKAHPLQPFELLKYKYREIRKENSNVIFIKSEFPSERLIRESEFIVTVSGTVGWEGLVLEKPVVVLGNVWYDKHPGVTKIRSTDGLRLALRGKIKSPAPKEESEKYLAQIASFCHPGYVLGSKSSEPGNADKFCNALSKELMNIG